MDTREIIRNRAHELGNAVFVSPDIPERKLLGAIKKIAGGGLPRESVVAVVDTSDTGDLSSGLLFAEDALYFSTAWSEPVCVPYGAIARAKAVGWLWLADLCIYRPLAKGERRFRLESDKFRFLRVVDTGELCRIYARRFSPDVAADILDTIAAAAKEEAGTTPPPAREPALGEKELLAGYKREWLRLKVAGTICMVLGIALCWTLFWVIPLIYVGLKLHRKCKQDADLPVRGLPLPFYKADTHALTGPAWWNILYWLGFGISAMCRRSRKRLEIMDAIVRENALPLETIVYRYEKAFRAPKTAWGTQLVRSVHSSRGLLEFSRGLLRSFHFLLQFNWFVRAKEDKAGRAFVRAWLKHLEDKGKITSVDLDGRTVVFKPDCIQSAVARMEELAVSADRIPQRVMTEGLREVLPLDDRNIDAFVRAYGADIQSYAFADGNYYVAGPNNRRVRICPVCGLAAVVGEGTGEDGRDETGWLHYCSDYCRETHELCENLVPDAQRLISSCGAGAVALRSHGTGNPIPSIVLGSRPGTAEKRIAMVGKGIGKFAGGKAGAVAGGALVATFVPGGCLLGPLGALIGRFIGKKLGKQAASWGMGALADDGAEDATVAELVQEEFGILAAMHGASDAECAQVMRKWEERMAGNDHFVEDVRSQGNIQRQYLARLMQPLFLEVCQARPRPGPEVGTGGGNQTSVPLAESDATRKQE